MGPLGAVKVEVWGFLVWLGPTYSGGTWRGPENGHCLHLPHAALLTLWMRQEEHLGASLPDPQSRALPGLPSSWPYLPLDSEPGPGPSKDEGQDRPFSLCVGRRGASLGCYTSRTETVLGPMDLG